MIPFRKICSLVWMARKRSTVGRLARMALKRLVRRGVVAIVTRVVQP